MCSSDLSEVAAGETRLTLGENTVLRDGALVEAALRSRRGLSLTGLRLSRLAASVSSRGSRSALTSRTRTGGSRVSLDLDEKNSES